ncbi:SMI1/KNR4 family protein [Pseudoxanthomonas sacheonensis]|uniref:SMI1/KNR4 family protein n=1 Tax=Pseudoxanthomonas sacheonensis TaxID=443615 RepID=UPI003D2F9A14
MEWQSTLSKLFPDARFPRGATLGQITSCEHLLGIKLPSDLKGLLIESDGILVDYGIGLVWPIARIEADNLTFRCNPDFQGLYMPFDSLLFFGEAGNGDQFAFSIQSGAVRRSDIFGWSHGDDSRTWIAPSLKTFFQWWASGHVKI